MSNNYYDKGLIAFQNGNYLEAMRLFKHSLTSSYSDSIYYIGYMYELGLGTTSHEPNYLKALKCYYEASLNGNTKAVPCFNRLYNNLDNIREKVSTKYPDMCPSYLNKHLEEHIKSA